MAQAGQTSLFQLAQTTELDLEFEVPQSWASVVTPGLAVEITSRELPGQPIKASVTRTAGSIDATTHTMHAEVRLSTKKPHSRQVAKSTCESPACSPSSCRLVPWSRALKALRWRSCNLGPKAHVCIRQITVLRRVSEDVEVLADGSVAIGAKLVISPPANLHPATTQPSKSPSIHRPRHRRQAVAVAVVARNRRQAGFVQRNCLTHGNAESVPFNFRAEDSVTYRRRPLLRLPTTRILLCTPSS